MSSATGYGPNDRGRKFDLEEHGCDELRVVRHLAWRFSLQLYLGDTDDTVEERGVEVSLRCAQNEGEDEHITYSEDDINIEDVEDLDALTREAVIAKIHDKLAKEGCELLKGAKDGKDAAGEGTKEPEVRAPGDVEPLPGPQ